MNRASAASAPSAAAARMRKSRARSRHGDVIVSLKLGSSEIFDLVSLGLMPATVRADKDALCRALIELIEQAIALRVTPTTTNIGGSCATVGPSVNEGDQDALNPARF
jgi:hypothetical protein